MDQYFSMYSTGSSKRLDMYSLLRINGKLVCEKEEEK